MDVPNIIKGSNNMQRDFVKKVMEHYREKFAPATENCSVLYLACRNGKDLVEHFAPLLPPHFNKIAGADSSEEFIEQAKTKYADVDPRISFYSMNFKDMSAFYTYNFIVSFWDLTYLHNLSELCNNILKTTYYKNKAIFIIEYESHLYTVIKKIATLDTWKDILKDVVRGLPPAGVISTLREVCLDKMQLSIHVDSKFQINKGYQAFKDSIDEMYTFRSMIPSEFYDAFIDKIIAHLEKDGNIEHSSDGSILIEIPVKYVTFLMRNNDPAANKNTDKDGWVVLENQFV